MGCSNGLSLPWERMTSALWWETVGIEADDESTRQRAKSLTTLQAQRLRHILPRCSDANFLTPETLATTMGMLRMNCISTFDGGGRAAIGLYPRLAMANHNCQPTAHLAIRLSSAPLVAICCTAGVSAGTEITIDYHSDIDAGCGKGTHLLHQYLFCCDCAQCCGRVGLSRNNLALTSISS